MAKFDAGRKQLITKMMANGNSDRPGLAFRDDIGCGLYRISADKIGLITGSDPLGGIVINDGNVGIGVATPTSRLDVVGMNPFPGRDVYVFFDDFDRQQTWVEAETPWILNSGTDPQAIDPAITSGAGGVALITTGDDDGVTAVDAAQLVCSIPVTCAKGNLVFETRLHINTAITNVAINAGFTDATGLEEPFSISAATITSNATDAACFVYDTSATVDQWFACAVDSDLDDTGNATTGVAPVADTYQTLRIELSSDGATISFYIDGVLKKTLSGAAGVTPSASLYATVIACGDSTASKTVDVDYIMFSHTR